MSVVVHKLIGVLRSLASALLDFAVWASGRFSRVADFVFGMGDEGRKLLVPALLIWVLLNVGVLVVVAAPQLIPLPVPPGPALLALPCAFASISFLLVSAALLKLREDGDVLNALIDEPDRLFKPNPAVSHLAIVLTSVLFLILFLAAAVQQVDGSVHRLLAEQPQSDFAFVVYLLATLKALPLFGAGVTAAAWVAERADLTFPVLEFTRFSGQIAAHAVFFIGSFFLLGLVTLWLKQSRDTDRLIEKYLTATGEVRQYLQHRIERSSTFIKPRVLRAAVTPRLEGKQGRAIEAAVQLRIVEFPREFCRKFTEQRRKGIKQLGLKRALQLVEEHWSSFGAKLITDTLSALTAPLSRTHIGSENNIAFSRLLLALLKKAASIAAMAPDDLRVISTQLSALVSRQDHKDNELQINALEVALRHGLDDVVVHFVERLDQSPKKLACEGLEKVRERISRDFGRPKFAEAILAPVTRYLASTSLGDEVRVLLEQLRDSAVARSKTQPSFAQRTFGWLKPSRFPDAAPSSKPEAAAARPSRDAA
jgi:hypothetical protein